MKIDEIHKDSYERFNYEFYERIIEYVERPTFPPPLILLLQIYLVLRWCCRKIGWCKKSAFDNNFCSTSLLLYN